MKKKLILDTNIILRYPNILTLGESEYDIIIPTDVLRELNVKFIHNNQHLNNSLLNLVNKAINQETVTVQDVNPSEFKELRELQENYRLSGADSNIILLGIAQKKSGNEVIIASQDREIVKAAQRRNISTFGLNDVSNLLESTQVSKNNEVLKEANQYSNSQIRNLIYSFILGVLVTLIGVIAYFNIDKIVSTINVWGTIILAIFFGIGLFVFREKKRLAYGVAEFSAGIATVIILFSPDFDYSQIDFSLSFGLKIFGALYIMVRGQDNIVKSLDGTKVGLWLKEKTGIGK